MTSFFLGYSETPLQANASSLNSSVHNSSDEFQDCERAWDPTNHLVHVIRREARTPVMSREPSSDKLDRRMLSPQRRDPPRHIYMPSAPTTHTHIAHGLPTCDDIESTKEFDFVRKPLPKAPRDFLDCDRPPSPPYTLVSSSSSAPLCPSSSAGSQALCEAAIVSENDDEEMAAFLEDEDYPASDEDEGMEEDEQDNFYIDSDAIKAAHESVLDLRALLEDKFLLIPGESVESLEKRALSMVHLEESFNVQDSFEPRTLLADQDRAFIPWIPVIEDVDYYFEMRYPELTKGCNRYDFHRARLIRNRTRLRILAHYVAELEFRSRSYFRMSRSL